MSEINHTKLAVLVEYAQHTLGDVGPILGEKRRQRLEEAIVAGRDALPAHERPPLPPGVKLPRRTK